MASSMRFMSSYRLAAAAATKTTTTQRSATMMATRSFATTGRWAALSESSRDTSKGTAEEIERLKNESVKKVKEGKGEHDNALASDSESAIKADRGEQLADDGMIQKVEEAAKRVVHDSAAAVKAGARKVEKATE